MHRFTFDSSFLDGYTKAQLAVVMFSDLVDTSSRFDQDKLLRFFLTINKNYRPNAYHNWDHAFSVAHCLFWVIRGTQKMFSEIEVSVGSYSSVAKNAIFVCVENSFLYRLFVS